jgi:Uma2 family endonuclease
MSIATSIKSPLEELARFGPITLQKRLTKEQFIELSSRFPDLRMEREKNGKTTIMSPVKKGSGKREITVSGFLFMWHYQHKSGEIFSPSTGIELPNGAVKSPDCAWVSSERLASLPENADEDFLQVVPDFVVEVRSASDSISKLKHKMADVWMANGVRLAWLIDPYKEKVWIYRKGKEPEMIEGFSGKTLNGENVMPGMVLPLDELKRK